MIKAPLVALALSTIAAQAQMVIPITDADFGTGGGQITAQTSVLSATPAVGATALGVTGWYGSAAASNAALNLVGYRGGLAVNIPTGQNNAQISYALAAGVGGDLLGLDVPEVNLWQNTTGTLLANTTYRLSIDITFVNGLTLGVLSGQGFGISITGGGSGATQGTTLASSLTAAPGLVSLNLLDSNSGRLNLDYTVGASNITNAGVLIFAGRGTEFLSATLGTAFSIDNVSLAAVPEPHTAVMFGLGFAMLLGGRRILRTIRKD